MTPTRFKEIREGMSLTTMEMAYKMCVTVRTVQRWESGAVVITAMAERLTIMLKEQFNRMGKKGGERIKR